MTPSGDGRLLLMRWNVSTPDSVSFEGHVCVGVYNNKRALCTFGTDSDTCFFSCIKYFSSSPIPLPIRIPRDVLIAINTAGLSLVFRISIPILTPFYTTFNSFRLDSTIRHITRHSTYTMPLKSTRSFSGKLLKRYRSKTKLNEEEHKEPVPALPTVSYLT